MGVKKAKSSRSSKVGKIVKAARSVATNVIGGARKSSSGKRRSRQTPEKLAKKLLVLKLQKKIWKAKYGGR